jgi:hypothetical protein
VFLRTANTMVSDWRVPGRGRPIVAGELSWRDRPELAARVSGEGGCIRRPNWFAQVLYRGGGRFS